MYQDFRATRATGRVEKGRLRSLGAAILREPLTHFIIAGALIFAVAHWLELRSQRYRIDIGPADIARITATYEQQYGMPPTPDQLRGMIGSHVKEEIFLREGMALGLDRDDEIVRRRIAQKYEFLQQDMAVARAPTEAQLRAFYATHRARYVVAARRSFDHIYFAIDQRGEAAAEALARQALAAAARGAPPTGDSFPGPAIIRLLSEADMGRLFGGDHFAAQVFAARPGQWAGPFRSGFGWHIVRVTEVDPARPRSYQEARTDVAADWKDADQRARNDANYAGLLGRYHVTIAADAR